MKYSIILVKGLDYRFPKYFEITRYLVLAVVGIIIFFSIITALDLVGLMGNIIVKTVDADGSSVVSGQEVPVVIFAFIAGIATFSEFFHMLTQNGISRKTISLSKPLVALKLSLCRYKITAHGEEFVLEQTREKLHTVFL